jgi:hypothetical protein
MTWDLLVMNDYQHVHWTSGEKKVWKTRAGNPFLYPGQPVSHGTDQG